MTPMVGTPLVEYVLAFSLPLSLQITITNIYVDLSISFPEVSSAPPTPLPCFYPHSKWAALGPVHVGVRFQAQVQHRLVMDLGRWVLPSRVRSLKDHSTQRSHPNKAVDVVPTKLFRYLFACEQSTYVDSLVFPSSSAWLSPVWRVRFLLCSGSARQQPPVRSRPAWHAATAHILLR